MCIAAGLPKPKYECAASDFQLEFRKDIYYEDYLRDLSLSDRQIKLVLYIKENKKITNSTYRNIFNLSEKTALRDFEKLVELGVVCKKGERKGTFYTLID